MASGDMISVDIDFTSTQGRTRKQTYQGVKIPRSSSIRELRDHLKHSKGITGRILMNKRELSNNRTLKELGIVRDTVLEMKSYTQVKEFPHSIPLQHPTGTINVYVHEITTTGGLKHIIQDEIGMPVEEQVLEYDGKQIMQDKRLVVEICVHKKTPMIVKPSKFKLLCIVHIIILDSACN